jgi:hypothetical protein
MGPIIGLIVAVLGIEELDFLLGLSAPDWYRAAAYSVTVRGFEVLQVSMAGKSPDNPRKT